MPISTGLTIDKRLYMYDFMFAVRVAGLGDFPCLAADGLEARLVGDFHKESDSNNQYPINTSVEYPELVLTVMQTKADSRMSDWKSLIHSVKTNRHGRLKLGVRRGIRVYYLDWNMEVVDDVNIPNCLPMTFKRSALDSMASSLCKWTISFSHYGWE